MTPSVGRIVHYVSHGTPPRGDGTQAYTPECRAAIVTEVGETTETVGSPAGDVEFYRQSVGLCVLNPTGQFFNCDVQQDEDSHASGTWHWPEQVRG